MRTLVITLLTAILALAFGSPCIAQFDESADSHAPIVPEVSVEPPPTENKTTVKAGSFVSIEAQLVFEDGRTITTWEVYEIDADFEILLSKKPTQVDPENKLVKYSRDQITQSKFNEEIHSEAILAPTGSSEKEDDFTKTYRAAYLFEGRWVSEGRIVKYVATAANKIEVSKQVKFKYRRGLSWSPQMAEPAPAPLEHEKRDW